MLKRSIILFTTLILLIFTVNADCYLNTVSNECKSFASPYNTFILNFLAEEDLDNYEIELYNSQNPSNKIQLEEIANYQYRNLNPFTEPGVYILHIKAYNWAKKLFEKDFEFVFDNTEPMPPIITSSLITHTNSIIVEGETKPGYTIIAQDLSGSQITTTALNDGTFQLTLNNLEGINYYKFIAQNFNSLTSSSTERIILSNPSSPLADATFSLFDPVSTNSNTYKEGNTFYTTKRNFYLEGTANSIEIYANGNPAKISGGKFGVFVLLNEGENNIKIQSGSNIETITVNYIRTNFQFLELSIPKVISEDTNIVGKANYDLPFNVYLNGQFVAEQTPQEGNIDFPLSNLKPGKNYLYIEGQDGQSISEFIYLDTQSPQLRLVSSENLASSNSFIFEVKDDTGIDMKTINVQIGNYLLTNDDVNLSGDFYKVDITKIPQGNYDYTITLSDLAGRQSVITGALSINSQNTVLEHIYIDNGYNIGNNIFVKSGINNIIISPSRYIAFEKFYLDGINQIDYEIKSNGDIYMTLDFQNENGTLKFTFLNSEREAFSQDFIYFTDDEIPQLKLDYIDTSQASENQRVKVTGTIEDSHFDWTSLHFNNENDFLRFGNHFEAYLKVENSGTQNLNIYGTDFALNSIQKNFGGILYKDVTSSQLDFENINKNLIIGTLASPSLRTNNYVYSYDGFKIQNTYIGPSNIKLATSPRQGLRSINLKGIESSGKRFSDISIISIDSEPPQIYFRPGAQNKLQIIIDGTLSNIQSVQITLNEEPISAISTCSSYTKISTHDICKEVNLETGLVITAQDSQGNTLTKTFNGNFDTLPTKTANLEIFFNGNDIFTTKTNHFIQGQITSSYPLTSVKVGSTNCEFDEYNFVCPITISSKENIYTVTATNSNGQSIQNSITINSALETYSLSLENIEGVGIYKVAEEYFINLDYMKVKGLIDKKSVITLLLDGRKILVGEKEGAFNIDVDLTEQLAGKNSDEISVQLEAEDKYGNKANSNTFTLIFNRVLETIVNIVVG